MWSPTDAHGRGQSTFPLSLLTQLCGAAATSHAGSEQPRAHLEPAAPQRGLPTAAPSWGTLVPPLSRLPQGLRAGGEGQKLKSTSSLLSPQQLKGRAPDPQLQAPQYGKQILHPICFLRDGLCIHLGAIWPFAIKSCIFHFSCFPLLCSFFPLDLLAGMVCGGMVNY